MNENSIDQAEAALRTLRNAFQVEQDRSGKSLDPSVFRDRFIEAMDDDLNTPRALAAIFDLAHAINRGHAAGEDISKAHALLSELTGVLGLTLQEPEREDSLDGIDESEIERMLSERADARAEKRWADADVVRDRLKQAGIAITDGPNGTTWSRL